LLKPGASLVAKTIFTALGFFHLFLYTPVDLQESLNVWKSLDAGKWNLKQSKMVHYFVVSYLALV
jgi:hypothetical protein